ncbi:MAG TPA: helix-turn-helix domain-containing protein [Ktedonobacteraceae bacterium]|nr:helix-turn-helix domain-containing protein [Ktedonobacteraceae bacterium]
MERLSLLLKSMSRNSRKGRSHVTKRAYKFRVYPTDEQQHNLAQPFGCCRFVYNWALSTRKRAYFDHGIKLSDFRPLSSYHRPQERGGHRMAQRSF